MTTWQHGDRTFIYRVAAVIVDQERVLLQPTPGGDSWSLPGRVVGFLESAADALQQAVQQEIGMEVIVERLLWVAEGFETRPERQIHALGLIFLARLSASESTTPSPETVEEGHSPDRSKARWFSLEAALLDTLQFDPPFLQDGLRHIPDQTVYLTEVH